MLAMGVTRSWRSALWGTALAVVALAGFTVIAGYAFVNWLPRSPRFSWGSGRCCLIFGLQWLRKAILRSSGLKSLHDEEEEFEEQAEAARLAGNETRYGLDWFAFVVSFKGVFLEGVEVVFIVITFGLNAHNVPLAAAGAAAAGVIVLAIGAVAHRPLRVFPRTRSSTSSASCSRASAPSGPSKGWASSGRAAKASRGPATTGRSSGSGSVVPAVTAPDPGRPRDRESPVAVASARACSRKRHEAPQGVRAVLVGLPHRRRLEDRGHVGATLAVGAVLPPPRSGARRPGSHRCSAELSWSPSPRFSCSTSAAPEHGASPPVLTGEST